MAPPGALMMGRSAYSRAQSRRSLTRSRMSPPRVLTVPPGISMAVVRIRLATWAKVKS